MQIVFFFDLLFNLLVDTQPDNKRIAPPGRSRWVGVDETQCFMQVADRLAGTLDFLVHRIFEIAGETLDFLGLFLQVVTETHELVDDFALHFGGLVGF